MLAPAMPALAKPITPTRFLWWTAGALAVIAAWDATGLDLALARAFGGPDGFALTRDWWLQNLLHTGARRLGWTLAAALALTIWWPVGTLRALPRASRAGLVIGIVLAALAVQWMKRASLTSCPWSLAEFGGHAAYVSHWRWGVPDGGGGRCFPAGHASVGFCYLAGWFWLRPHVPRAARLWLAASLLAGLGLGAVQMARGAHYLSHVLWSGWTCWTAGGAFWLAVQALRRHSLTASASGRP
jgi:membrane-associated PAP2 superfamily phosphatase